MQTLHAVDAKPYSTFRLPAQLKQLTLIEQLSELDLLSFTEPPLILGEGSNSIFLTNISKPIVKLKAGGITHQISGEHVLLHVEAGHNWHQLVAWTVQQGWWGLENLALIPGSVGAAPVQNIGAYGVELMDVCQYVEFYHWQDKKTVRLNKQDCQFGYRESIFKHALAGQGVITAVGLQLNTKGTANLTYKGLDHLSKAASVQSVFDTVIALRQSKLPDPVKLANCGSFFKNPLLERSHYDALAAQYQKLPCYPQTDGRVKTAAAFLIEQAGFKGQQSGGIGCYALQPLVLFNDGSGTAEQLCQWIAQIQTAVVQKFAITLEPEVRLLRD